MGTNIINDVLIELLDKAQKEMASLEMEVEETVLDDDNRLLLEYIGSIGSTLFCARRLLEGE